MALKEKQKLEVTVDKRHIVSIGERLYTESVELLRELINIMLMMLMQPRSM